MGKLADFGTAFDLSLLGSKGDRIQTFCGTPIFMAPEVVSRENYTTASDIWSFGGMCFEMLTGRVPFHHPVLQKLLNQIASGKELEWPVGTAVQLELKLFVMACMQRDATRRPSAEDLLDHSIFHAATTDSDARVQDYLQSVATASADPWRWDDSCVALDQQSSTAEKSKTSDTMLLVEKQL